MIEFMSPSWITPTYRGLVYYDIYFYKLKLLDEGIFKKRKDQFSVKTSLNDIFQWENATETGVYQPSKMSNTFNKIYQYLNNTFDYQTKTLGFYDIYKLGAKIDWKSQNSVSYNYGNLV